MKSNGAEDAEAVSDQVLRGIVEEGFFGTAGRLAEARAACAELLFARSVIEAQNAKLASFAETDVLTEPVNLPIP